MLKSIDKQDLIDHASTRGPDAQLGFAASSSGCLYTIQEQTQLTAWALDDQLKATKRASLALPETWPASSIQHQFADGRLVLWRAHSGSLGRRLPNGYTSSGPSKKDVPGRLIIVDLHESAKPVSIIEDVAGLKGCVAALGKLFLVVEGKGLNVAEYPSAGAKKLAMKVVVPEKQWEGDRGRRAVVANDSFYWGSSEHLDVMPVGEPSRSTSIRFHSCVGQPVLISDDKLALLEVSDNQSEAAIPAVALFDISSAKPEKQAVFHKKQSARAWRVVGDELFVAMRSSKKIRRPRTEEDEDEEQFPTFMSVIDAAKGKEVRAEDLPFIESTYDSGSEIIWLDVRGKTLAVLLRNGQLHRFSF